MFKHILLRFGKSGAVIKRAGGENLSNLADAEMIQKGRLVERIGHEYTEALKLVGLTTEMLVHMSAAINLFEQLIDKQKDHIVYREIKTRERVSKANELYKVAKRFSYYGKAAFEDTHPVLYKSYLLGDKNDRKEEITNEIYESLVEELD